MKKLQMHELRLWVPIMFLFVLFALNIKYYILSFRKNKMDFGDQSTFFTHTKHSKKNSLKFLGVFHRRKKSKASKLMFNHNIIRSIFIILYSFIR